MGENLVNRLSVIGLAGTTSAPAQGVVQALRNRDARVLITDRPFAWRAQVVDRLNYLCCLPVGWNGYGAGPVNFNTANFALRVLESVCSAETPAPSIVPGSSGDLQIEWHLETGDIELHVRAPYDVQAWYEAAAIWETYVASPIVQEGAAGLSWDDLTKLAQQHPGRAPDLYRQTALAEARAVMEVLNVRT